MGGGGRQVHMDFVPSNISALGISPHKALQIIRIRSYQKV